MEPRPRDSSTVALPKGERLPEAHQQPYSFALDDKEAWLQHLTEHGYVVLRACADSSEVEAAQMLFWDELRDRFGVVQGDPDTYDRWNPKRSIATVAGLLGDFRQSPVAWAVRGFPGVKRAFAHFWNDEDLIVSMDPIIVWKPWWVNKEWLPRTEGLHLDQNPFEKPDLDCIQGMVPLLAVTKATGGLQVVPDSHKDPFRADWMRRYETHYRDPTDGEDPRERRGNFCPCDDHPAAIDGTARLLLAEPGDLILWDSRVVHGGKVGNGQVPLKCPNGHTTRISVAQSDDDVCKMCESPIYMDTQKNECQTCGWHLCEDCWISSRCSQSEMARLSVPVAMTQRSRATEHVLQKRLEGVERDDLAFTHVAHEFDEGTNGAISGVARLDYTPPKLSETQRMLL